jgi:hypothetical protein
MPEMRDSFLMVMKRLFGCRGSNEFLSPGESLLQHVLDDPLLALARTDGKSVCNVKSCTCLSLRLFIDPSFQVLHAIYSMERLLNEMLRRSAIFDIVFWEGKLRVVAQRFNPDRLTCF